jgi:hypothetical protein
MYLPSALLSYVLCSYFETNAEEIAQDVCSAVGKPIVQVLLWRITPTQNPTLSTQHSTQARAEASASVKKMRQLSSIAPYALKAEVLVSDSSGLTFAVERVPKVGLSTT